MGTAGTDEGRLKAQRKKAYSKKGGDGRPLFWRVSSLPLLAALLLRPALGRLLCHCSYPPLHSWDSDARSVHRVAVPLPSWHVGPLMRRPSLRCLVPPGEAFGISWRTPKAFAQKIGGVNSRHPRSERRRLALLPALFLRAALSSLLGHESSLGLASSALLSATHGHHRWAERSTLIQDVDYG